MALNHIQVDIESHPVKVIISNSQTQTIYNRTKKSQDNDQKDVGIIPQHPSKDDDTKHNDEVLIYFFE